MYNTRKVSLGITLILSMLASFALAGCAPTQTAATAPTISDAWVKAVPEMMGEMAMTGVFMDIENTSNEELFLVSATNDTLGLTDMPLEVHEVLMNDSGEMVMQKIEGVGIPLAAKSTVQLKPGGYHIMYTGLKKTIPVGSTIELTVKFSNGTQAQVQAVAREVANANETYVPEEDAGGHSGMDME